MVEDLRRILREISRETWKRTRRAGGKLTTVIPEDGETIEIEATPSGKRVKGTRERYLHIVTRDQDGQVTSDNTSDANTGKVLKTPHDK